MKELSAKLKRKIGGAVLVLPHGPQALRRGGLTPGGQSALRAELETCAHEYPDRASPSGFKDTSLSHQPAKRRSIVPQARGTNITPAGGLSDSFECRSNAWVSPTLLDAQKSRPL